jgi:hypothetical protein
MPTKARYRQQAQTETEQIYRSFKLVMWVLKTIKNGFCISDLE